MIQRVGLFARGTQRVDLGDNVALLEIALATSAK